MRYGTVTGSTLDINMRAGQLQYYDLTLHCEVTATTPHGVSAVADSGPIEVSSGCEEWYADVVQAGTIDAHIGGPQRWLFATDPDQLFDYDESGAPLVAGLFGLQGGGVDIDGPDGPNERASRAETDGPNCADYQRYLRGQGYDVKQGPNPDGDMFWIEHGTCPSEPGHIEDGTRAARGVLAANDSCGSRPSAHAGECRARGASSAEDLGRGR